MSQAIMKEVKLTCAQRKSALAQLPAGSTAFRILPSTIAAYRCFGPAIGMRQPSVTLQTQETRIRC